MKDEFNPNLIFTGTPNELLIKIITEQININFIAKQTLANRGYDLNNKWIGFDQAKKELL
ncbi:hypothetical protein KAR91_64030 [Candidatus Pacearchaeota archaeon]|nr:hypothetical protein [Candidatus Pacearchaeota archaeon]